MTNRRSSLKRLAATLVCAILFASSLAAGHPAPKTVRGTALTSEIRAFLDVQIRAHLKEITTLSPPPERVYGALTTGEFSWGSFMRAVAAYSETSGERAVDGRDLARLVGQMGLIEAKGGGKAFSQLYSALSLRHFGADLKTNPLWNSLNDEEKAAWRSLLDPERFYDAKTGRVKNLPENYLGVAARIAAVGFQLGLTTDRKPLDTLLERAAVQFLDGALYADDNPSTGRYDRYSNEYARYIWDAAGIAGRNDIRAKLAPTLTRQMKLWADLVAEDGYGYGWGRSLGVVSYLDTLEIVAFLGANPEFRPMKFADLAALYRRAWRHIRSDFLDDRHLLNVFGFGRGNFAYISREREWQQTGTFFGKLAVANALFEETLKKEGDFDLPDAPSLPDAARFEFFRKGERAAGVWVVRHGAFHFALPITTGTKPGVADYLPVPHGFAGIAMPVEQILPALTPFLTLPDGKTIVAGDGADFIEPGADGRSLKVVWKRWPAIGADTGTLTDPGLTSEVVWRLDGTTLYREETLTASRDLTIANWRCVVPATGTDLETAGSGPGRADRFTGPGFTFETSIPKADWPISTTLRATGDSPAGRGAQGAIPLLLIHEAKDLQLKANVPRRWTLILKAAPAPNRR